MSRTLKKTDIPERTPEKGTILRFPRSRVEAVSPEELLPVHPVSGRTFGNRIEAVERRAGATLRAAGSQVAATYRTVKRHSAGPYNYISLRCRRFVSKARDRSSRAQNERPLAALGALAGAAFISGILIRVWRSSRHA